MKHPIISCEKEYRELLERFEEVFQAEPGSKESDEADVLALSLKEYEDKHFLIGPLNKKSA